MSVTSLAACVFPVREVAGIEFSWRFMEVNTVDETEDNDGLRTRTCAGIEADEVEIRITDTDDSDRAKTFQYGCEIGFQTLEEFQVQASDVFVGLDKGIYNVEIRAIGTSAKVVLSDRDEVTVESRGVSVVGWPLDLPSIDWTIRLSGTSECDDVDLRLRYEDAGSAIAGMDEDGTGGDTDGSNGANVTYRDNLASDRGLEIGGTGTESCARIPAGAHTFTGVDIGQYVLEIDVDGVDCDESVVISPDAPTLVLDLANLPCGG